MADRLDSGARRDVPCRAQKRLIIASIVNPLSAAQIDEFVNGGFVKIDRGFPASVAAEARAILWRETGCDPNDPATWTKPVIRLGPRAEPPFEQAANTAILQEAFDQLVGRGRWLPRTNLGTFPLRFPSADDPGDAGWHIDVSFRAESDDPNDFLAWRANVVSKGRALLMLFLFSDVGHDDAPTRIRVGSHLDVARMLAPAGDRGVSLRELAANEFAETAGRAEVLATGDAGTVYLCHPFLVHAAQPHRGTRPRFLAQPPLLPAVPFELERPQGDYSPVELAIKRGLSGAAETRRP
jgi:hypothetical protein